MCELFGLSARHPLSTTNTPLAEFRRHGGATADNPDGWGIAWREPGPAPGFLVEKEPLPAWRSARFAGLIETLRSELIIAHVRKARFPPVNTLANTQPFLDECCGRHWAFAHNGLVPEIVALETASRERVCRPKGETDSEFAFCHLLGHVARQFNLAGTDAAGLDLLGGIGELIARHGKFNFLLSDGDCLAAYGHDRLHCLESSHGNDAVVLIATEPLNAHGAWTPFEPGELRLYRAGERVGRIATHPPVPRPDLEPLSP